MTEEHVDRWPAERIIELLETLTRPGSWDARRALAVERTASRLSPRQRAAVAEFLQDAIALTEQRREKLGPEG
jgi:hypothetical protein